MTHNDYRDYPTDSDETQEEFEQDGVVYTVVRYRTGHVTRVWRRDDPVLVDGGPQGLDLSEWSEALKWDHVSMEERGVGADPSGGR